MKNIVFVALAACAGPQFHKVESSTNLHVERIDLTWSNVYLISNANGAILVDSGSPQDRDALEQALAAAHIHPRAVVLTHAHQDHAGLAHWLQSQGAKVLLGAGDVPMAARGMSEPLPATGLLGGWLAPLFMFHYEPFTPDVAVDHEINLADYGLPEVAVVPAPGHTPGSLVVIAGRDAFGGDLLKGGAFAKIDVTTPSEHYYQDDPVADHKQIAAVLDRGVTRVHLGHGGPIAADDLRDYLKTADDPQGPRFASVQLGAEGGISDGPNELGGVLRIRNGIGETVGLFGGLDLRVGGFGGGFFRGDAYPLGVMLRDRRVVVGLSTGLGYGSLWNHGETHIPVELYVECPLLGPLHLFGRFAATSRTTGSGPNVWRFVSDYEQSAGIRLGRNHWWGHVIAGGGPYVAFFQSYGNGDHLNGLGIGWQMSAGN